MADLKPLTDQIYHEKQQDGSMLCAQHALNSLLQGGYFTAPDLSAIAAKLDDLEGSLDTEGTSNGQRKESANMDDTGFFSIQVMDEALQLWGLRMVHWRSPEMKAHQAAPNQQFAFILNLQQHWFTIRRFGLAQEPENATPEEAEKSHWFNLNSFLDQPEWVGTLYLGMMLQQAEQEGYSVYAILRIDQESPLEMLSTPADEIASTLTLSELGLPSRLSTNRTARHSDSGAPEGLEDEDMELQAALQASMMGGVDQVTIPSGPIQPTPRRSMFADALPTDENDPVASSMARSRAIMDQMLRHQEAAFRETADDVPLPRRRRTRGEEEEEEALKAALQASQGDNEDEEWLETADLESRPLATQSTPSTSRATGFAHQTGVYDDDDAAFQAALKASLEDMPEGATVPDVVAAPPRASISSSVPASASVSAPKDSVMDEDEEYVEEDEEDKKKPEPVPEPSVDMDEMRKKRLARFGGS